MNYKNNYQNLQGLTSYEVSDREKSGQVNGEQNIPSKSIAEIFRTNTLTFFNMLNLCLAAAVFLTGEYENMLFIGVIIANIAIGIIQEIRAKRVIDRLSLISAAKAAVLRDGKITEIPISLIVLDEVIILSEGMQIPADSEILTGEIEVNESLVTGESHPVGKKAGDSLLSGSFVICGEAAAIVRKIGEDSFAFSIMKGAKYLKKPVSETLRSIDKIIKSMTFVIVPVGIILFIKSLFFTGDDMADAINSSVAALIGMIPQGLILTTGIVMAISVIRLSSHNALARDMYCAETLARVDLLCLDKTGTITSGDMNIESLTPLYNSDLREIENALCTLMSVLPDKNPTASAIRKTYSKSTDWQAEKTVPFSSSRKWSGASFKNKGSYILGAEEFILGNSVLSKQLISEGKRVLILAKSHLGIDDNNSLPQALKPVAVLSVSDVVRPEAKKTLNYFHRHGVKIKIISGDNPLTVKSAALSAGVKDAENYIDMSKISVNDNPSQDKNYTYSVNIAEIAEKYTIFGRVTPQMKLELIKTLRQNHTVGMVGDGVNDVLPLKEADCSVAMQSGSEAARNVSSLVLLDNNFSSLPKAVAEGRRSINNLERGAALFLAKTVYSLLLAVIFLFLTVPYPFLPVQMTLISSLFIGLPAFILAFEKNRSLVRGGFLQNVLIKAVPYGLCAVIGIALLTLFAGIFDFSFEETRTAATIVLGMVSFAILCGICRPINKQRLALIALCGVLFSLSVNIFDDLLSVTEFTAQMHVVTFFLCVFTLPLCIIFPRLAEKIVLRYKSKK
ncbi:MAG: cation-translocating P-type ATPase [Oscillospiraceae bacterium]|nr:cation-translocating P-type ATPase [Oscillospiraceae bacterium]